MSDAISEVPSSSPNFRTEIAEKLAELVPEVVADGKIDVEVLKNLLDEDAAVGSERFGLFWPGKAQAARAAQTPTTATLAPERENSVDWDNTQNVFIEGDNLEVLKILQRHYFGKIKMIYIDPPYNRGDDLIYKDDYTDPMGSYLKMSGQADGGGVLTSNTEKSGRFHSKWLNMIFPRLKMARNLMTQDGVIFISISDHEVSDLRLVADEIFGSDNFIADIIWNSTKSVTNTALISVSHTHNLVYAKSLKYFTSHKSEFRLPEEDKGFHNPDNDPRGPWKADPFQVEGVRPNQRYEIINPNTGEKYIPNLGCSWKNDYKRFKVLLEEDRIVFGATGESGPQRKRFRSEAMERGRVSKTLWDDVETTASGTRQLKEMFDNVSPFPNPKPIGLVERMIQLGCPSDGIILDFFAGSGTVAHSVMRLNSRDGRNRKCISVQIPEPVPSEYIGRGGNFSVISEISRERIRRAGKKVLEEEAGSLGERGEPLDVGFRSYKLVDTNFARWNLTSEITADGIAQEISYQADSSDDDASSEWKLTELLIKLGFSLTEKIHRIYVSGLEVFSVADGLVLAYTDEHTAPTLEQLRALVAARPEKLIIVEDAFHGNDELKTNLVQECRTHHVDLHTA